MKSKAITHQFEFWTNLGQVGGYMHQFDGYTTLLPHKGTWPSKTFNLQDTDIVDLKHEIISKNIPNVIALDATNELNQLLIENGFSKTSVVEGMSLKVTANMVFEESTHISKVIDEKGIYIFAKIASEAFGYTILPTSIIDLLKDENTQLFIGKHQGQFVSCGILFLDKKGDAGLHMIGAKIHYRGLGLGKEMTQHVLYTALQNKPNNIYLAASKFGAPIYRKYGFVNDGYLHSYTL